MIRLFVALRPPETVRAALLALMGGVPGARWQTDAQLHLTLAFIGEVDGDVAMRVDAGLASIASPTLAVSLAGIGHFGAADRPHALWVGAQPGDALAALAAKVTRACRHAGAAVERRAFVPHVTLARLNRAAGPIAPFLAAHGDFRAPPWRAEGFALYESRLGAGAAAYTPLRDYPLR